MHVQSAALSNVLKIGNSQYFKGTGLANAFDGRAVQVGDIVRVTKGSVTNRRTVVGLIGKLGTATTDPVPANSVYNAAQLAGAAGLGTYSSVGIAASAILVTNPGSFNGASTGAKFQTFIGDEFTLTISSHGATAGLAAAVLTSASGLYSGNLQSTNSSNDYLFTDSAGAFFGTTTGMPVITVKLVFAQTGTVVAGQVYKFTIKQQTEQIAPTSTGTYTGAVNTTIIAEVVSSVLSVASNAFVPASSTVALRLSDTSNVSTPFTTALTAATAGSILATYNGISFKVPATFGTAQAPQGGFRKGDIYTITVLAAAESTTLFDRLLLDGPAIDTSANPGADVAVDFVSYKEFSGEILKTDNAQGGGAWSVTASGGVTTAPAGLFLYVSGKGTHWCAFKNATGTLSLYYRALNIPAATDGLVPFTTTSEIVAEWGPIDIDNDMAFGAAEMLRGSQGMKTCYGVATNGRNSAAFIPALKKIEYTSLPYAICAVTDDFDVALLTATHCLSMSGPTKKLFRRCYFGSDSPGKYLAKTGITCQITDHAGTGIRYVTLAPVGNVVTSLSTYNVGVGDTIKLTATNAEYTIVALGGQPNEFIIAATGAPSSEINAGTSCALYRADTAVSQAQFIRARSRALANRRSSHVWVENGTRELSGVTTIIPNRYVAAHIAGLRSALLPQQGLSRTGVTSISDASAMYLRYNDTTLNEVAADGTWIITQNAESGSIYVRHQLTTGVGEGALGYEDSVGVGVDALSSVTTSIVDQYIGIKNLTKQTMVEMRAKLHDAYFGFTQTTYAADAGPLLVKFTDLKIIPDTVLKDRAKITVTWVFPLPFNIGDIYVNVVQDVGLAPVVA